MDLIAVRAGCTFTGEMFFWFVCLVVYYFILVCLFSCLLFHLLRFFVCAKIIQLPHFCSASFASFVALHADHKSWTSR